MKASSTVLLAAFIAIGVAFVGPYAEARGFASRTPPAAEFKARVVYVDDGDTVVVLNETNTQIKIRLASIDAPESSHTNKEVGRVGQPYSEGATRYLSHLVKGRVVDLKCQDTDRYGRSVCELLVDGQSVDREMVRQGWAWANEAARGRYMRDPQLPALEAEARKQRRGLWAGANPVAPWEWRSRCWTQHVCPS